MSIELRVEEYCQDCPMFKAYNERLCIESMDCERLVTNTVMCDRAMQCDTIYRYLKSKFEKGDLK